MAGKGCTNGETLRIMLLGKTGAGKSTLGNALTGLKAPRVMPSERRDERPPRKDRDTSEGFEVGGRSISSQSMYCDWRKAQNMGTVLEVTDTPSLLCETHFTDTICKELGKSLAVSQPGPHVIIFVLRCDSRLTHVDIQAYTNMKNLFSEEMNKYLIFVFNGLDAYKELAGSIEEQREKLAGEVEVNQYGKELRSMLEEAGGRFFGMNHKVSPSEIDRQIYDLITMMKDLVRQNGQHQYYRTQLTDLISQKVEQLVENKMAKSQATIGIKEDIISEVVEQGVFDNIVEVVFHFARGTKANLEKMCSIM